MLTQRHIDKKAEHLAEQQQKFVNTLYMLFDVIEGMQKYIAAHTAQVEAHEAVMKAEGEQFKIALDAFQSLIVAFGESNRAVNENNERLDKFIVKMESYFGSGTGLEYEN